MLKRLALVMLACIFIFSIMNCGIKKEAKMHNNRGVRHLNEGEYLEAIEELNKAVEISPKFVQAHSNLGSVYAKIDCLDYAIKSWAKVSELDETNSEVIYFMGKAFFKLGQPDTAFALFDRAIAMKEDWSTADPGAFRDAYIAKKKEEEAIAAGKMWARQIVVNRRRDALNIIKQLDEGADFVKLAQERSTDALTAPHGGDLGFFFENEKGEFIVSNIKALEKDQYSKTPIKRDGKYYIFLRLN